MPKEYYKYIIDCWSKKLRNENFLTYKALKKSNYINTSYKHINDFVDNVFSEKTSTAKFISFISILLVMKQRLLKKTT